MPSGRIAIATELIAKLALTDDAGLLAKRELVEHVPLGPSRGRGRVPT